MSADYMEELGKLPKEQQEKILSQIASEDLLPISIDDKVYYIPKEVMSLIDFLSGFQVRKNAVSDDTK